MGPNLIIMEKKDIKVGGFMGIMAKNKVKVTYGVEDVALNNKSIKSKNDNKDIMELLEKMGFDSKKGETKSGNRSILEDEGVKVEIDGVYNPYQKNNSAKNKKKGLEGNKNSDNANSSFKEIMSNDEKIKEENKNRNIGLGDINYIKESLKEEITKELKNELYEKNSFSEEETNEEPDEEDIVEILKDNEVDKKIAKKIKEYLEINGYENETLMDGVKKYFTENIKVSEGGFRSKFVMFIGPTGVGKTTTAAKIVANRWREEHDVGFITADTYRLEAVSQLKAYANIMRVPVEVIKKTDDLVYSVDKFKQKDFVIIDTAGRSPKNRDQMEELKNYLNNIGVEIEVCLVLSATTKLSVMYETIEKFGYIGFSSVIFTKIDETTTTGSILSVCQKYNLPVSYITTGQKVPGDVEIATKDRLTEIFFKELI